MKPLKVGTVTNPVKGIRNSRLTRRSVHIRYPSRLEAMALDPSKIEVRSDSKYTAGQVDFCVALYKHVRITVHKNTSGIRISEQSPRPALIRHAAGLMKSALHFSDGLDIDVVDQVNLRHCGLGSSSGLIASVACAINELFGKTIPDEVLVRYLAQNHGEEIDDKPNMIMPVQCLGGSAACGIYPGGLVLLAGESVVVQSMDVPAEYGVVIGVPRDFRHPDAQGLMKREELNMEHFVSTGKKYGELIAYRILHECMPEISLGKLTAVGNLIFDYRYKMGSIDNCTFVYPGLRQLADQVVALKKEGVADVLSLSSVGPGMFAISRNLKECEAAFSANNMNTITAAMHNGTYEVIEEKS